MSSYVDGKTGETAVNKKSPTKQSKKKKIEITVRGTNITEWV